MKRLIGVLIILACVLSVPFTASATNEDPIQPRVDFVYTDKEPQYNDKEPQPSTDLNDDSVISDAPAAEDTYEEQPSYSDTPRLADGEVGRGSIEDLDKYWATNGYPDDISFAYEAGGEMLEDGTMVKWWEIGIVNADDNRKQEIIDMLSPNCIVTFIDCRYSHRQREAAYNEILASKDDNILGAVMLLNSEVVMVKIAEGHEKEYAKKFIQQYSSFVVVTNNLDGAKEDTLLTGSAEKGNMLWIWTITTTLLMGATAILFFNRTRLIPAMQTTTGKVVTQSTSVSRKETISAIKNSETSPSDEVFSTILCKIDGEDC